MNLYGTFKEKLLKRKSFETKQDALWLMNHQKLMVLTKHIQLIRSCQLKTEKDAIMLLVENPRCEGVIIYKNFDEIYIEKNIDTKTDTDNLITIPKDYGDLMTTIEIISENKATIEMLNEISEISFVNKKTGEIIYSTKQIYCNKHGNMQFIECIIPIICMPEMQLKISSNSNRKYKLLAGFIYLDTPLRAKIYKDGFDLSSV